MSGVDGEWDFIGLTEPAKSMVPAQADEIAWLKLELGPSKRIHSKVS
jgi:hypothetical protein